MVHAPGRILAGSLPFPVRDAFAARSFAVLRRLAPMRPNPAVQRAIQSNPGLLRKSVNKRGISPLSPLVQATGPGEDAVRRAWPM